MKKYSLLVPEIRGMVTVMDAVTGIYEKPRKSIHPELDQMYEAQKKDLALKIANTVTAGLHVIMERKRAYWCYRTQRAVPSGRAVWT